MPIAARDAFTVPADEGFVVALQIGWESIALGTIRLPTAGLTLDIQLLAAWPGLRSDPPLRCLPQLGPISRGEW
jgi:hypothetical protein